jgi:ATP-dependent helicase HepA
VLAQDGKLMALATRLDPAKRTFTEDVHSLLHHVGDTYRINRRILRNRRARLLGNEQLDPVERRLNRLPFQPEQLELDARASLRGLLQTLQRLGCDELVLHSLARQLFQALCDPVALSTMLQLTATPPVVDQFSHETLSLDGLVGYPEWEKHICTLWALAKPHLNSEELRRAKHSATLWRDGVKIPLRIEILIEFLKQRHRKVPEAKFLIFAGFPGLANRVADFLEEQFQRSSVARFNYQMPDAMKEKEVRRFKRDGLCWILASDETGGEGRNFQFADELIHFDTPWYASKIEQRIGRLDRLGRVRRDVTSNVLLCEGEEEDGLLDCFANGFEVFSRSISGLEFALRELERTIVRTAIGEGKDGLVALAAGLKVSAENERAQDESQDLLDEGSMERMSATAFLRVQSTPERDRALEQTFVDYFYFIGGPRSVRYVGGRDDPEGVLSFQPEDIRGMNLALSKEANGSLRERNGTFRRAIAQERPDLEFFSVGNEFFDAVCASLYQSPKGRTYAVECSATHGSWRGFEFIFRAIGNKSLLGDHSGLLNQLDRIFTCRIEHCFIGEDSVPAPDVDALLKLRRSLKKETKDRVWWNFTAKNGRAESLEGFYAGKGWAALVAENEQLARALVRERYKESLASALETEHARIAEQVRQLKVVKPDGWEEDLASVELFGKAIDAWDVELEGAGYFSINGGLAK